MYFLARSIYHRSTQYQSELVSALAAWSVAVACSNLRYCPIWDEDRLRLISPCAPAQARLAFAPPSTIPCTLTPLYTTMSEPTNNKQQTATKPEESSTAAADFTKYKVRPGSGRRRAPRVRPA